MSKKVKLTKEQVEYVAYLARLGLNKEEIGKFRKQLSAILDYVDKLAEVDTEKVHPTSQVTGLENVFREDEVRSSLSQEEVLKNAPDKYNGFFKVKPIF